jgi:hypothetical protein
VIAFVNELRFFSTQVTIKSPLYPTRKSWRRIQKVEVRLQTFYKLSIRLNWISSRFCWITHLALNVLWTGNLLYLIIHVLRNVGIDLRIHTVPEPQDCYNMTLIGLWQKCGLTEVPTPAVFRIWVTDVVNSGCLWNSHRQTLVWDRCHFGFFLNQSRGEVPSSTFHNKHVVYRRTTVRLIPLTSLRWKGDRMMWTCPCSLSVSTR